MSNPFAQIRTAVQSSLGNVSNLQWVAAYDGQDAAEMRNRAARGGAGAFVRVFGGNRDPDNSLAAVDADTVIEVNVVATSVRNRATAAESAEQLVWDVIDTLQGSLLSLSFIFPLQLRAFAVAEQKSNTVVFNVVFVTRFDMSEWVG